MQDVELSKICFFYLNLIFKLAISLFLRMCAFSVYVCVYVSNVCMYVCMYICMYKCIQTHTHTHMCKLMLANCVLSEKEVLRVPRRHMQI